MDPIKRRGRAGNKDAQLVKEAIEGVEGAVLVEGTLVEGKQQRRGHALVDGILGDVDEKKGQHVRDEEGASAAQVGRKRRGLPSAADTRTMQQQALLRSGESSCRSSKAGFGRGKARSHRCDVLARIFFIVRVLF